MSYGRGFYRLLLATIFVLMGTLISSNSLAQKFDDGPNADKDYPFSESAKVSSLLFLSGQVGDTVNGELVEGGIVPETHQVMKNINDVLARRGLTFDNVVKCTAFLADVNEWSTFNQVYVSYLKKPYPARSALGANGLALGARVELECIADYQ